MATGHYEEGYDLKKKNLLLKYYVRCLVVLKYHLRTESFVL